MNKSDTKKNLLDVGFKLVLENGYNHTGLNEILAAADVPKGSFYYYFGSKEDFGLQLVAQFEQRNNVALKQYLQDSELDPLARLQNYFQFHVDKLISLQCRQGCLMGNLAQEMSDQSETFRLRVKAVMDEWAAQLSGCIKLAQEAGQVAADLDSQKLGQFCLDNWQGAILMMKVTKSLAPLEAFMQNTFEIVLKTD